jgi:hypothetical protein
MTDAEDHAIAQSFDDMGRVLRVSSPDSGLKPLHGTQRKADAFIQGHEMRACRNRGQDCGG